MPTKLRRIVLNLPPEVEAAISDLAEAHGRPLATVTVNLLAEMTGQIHALAQVYRHTKSGNTQAVKRAVSQMFGDTMGDLLQEIQNVAPLPKGRRK